MGAFTSEAVPPSVRRNSYAGAASAGGIANTTEWTEVRHLRFASGSSVINRYPTQIFCPNSKHASFPSAVSTEIIV